MKYINFNGDVDEKYVLKLIDFFYHKEHLFIITELLKDNLYEYQKFLRETKAPKYFTIGRLQKVTYNQSDIQLTFSLAYKTTSDWA